MDGVSRIVQILIGGCPALNFLVRPPVRMILAPYVMLETMGRG